MFISLVLCMASCMENAQFTTAELNFAKPFMRTDTAIYKSDSDQIDTIIFHAASIDTVRLRNMAQGFYNDNILRVSYELTPKCYHKFTVPSTDGNPVYFISFAKVKDSYSTKEIYFLGLLFNEKYLDHVEPIKEKSILFSEDRAVYKDVDINETIRNFEFDFDRGVVSFVDIKGIKWRRIN